MNTSQYDNVNLIKNEIPYSKIVDLIYFVVENSYSKNDGQYHEYLMDYSEAVAILTMYTDYGSDNLSFDEVMNFVNSNKWKLIKEELGDDYNKFHYYVQKEIEYRNTPLRFADVAMKNVSTGLGKINELLGAIDIEALKQYDMSKIISTIDGIEALNNKDNVVAFKKPNDVE